MKVLHFPSVEAALLIRKKLLAHVEHSSNHNHSPGVSGFVEKYYQLIKSFTSWLCLYNAMKAIVK